MSARDHLVSVSSMEPICQAVGSGKATLVKSFAKKHPDYREMIDTLVNSPPSIEPGCWNYMIRLLADHLKLSPNDDLDFNEGCKHYHTWEPYREELADTVSPEIDKLLQFLQDGRPLKGSKIEHDGCVFAWLTHEETQILHEALSEIDPADFSDDDNRLTHEMFVDSLSAVVDRGHALFLQAH